MWCKSCNKEVYNEICEHCGENSEIDIPTEVYWCSGCQIPIIKVVTDPSKEICTVCNNPTTYMATDIRPVFPEERLLYEAIIDKPLKYIDKSVWANGSRYYIDNKSKLISSNKYNTVNIEEINEILERFKDSNNYKGFNAYIKKFINANRERLDRLKDEAYTFTRETAKVYDDENIVISFSGGKDSSVVADIVVRALGNPSLVHIFGDTTLEFPLTYEYSKRFKTNNPMVIYKTAKNKEQEFYKVCEDIGPPARMLRWCCTMFKTGPITRVINNLYRDKDILTFYGIRKNESASRSKYNRVEDNAESIKIQQQKVASPVFYWKDIDIWLYILAENIDFNDAYRLGYDRVGCWCCPNNSGRAQFLSKVYMPEQSKRWREFLVDFARKIGKPDPEVYIDTGKWKARQGGNGVRASEDVKIKYTNCTSEENSKIYKLNQPIDDYFLQLFIPFGIVAKELGRKLINETIILDNRTNTPIISIQPFNQDGYDYAVKIKTLNVEKHDKLQRMISYQIRKFNACRRCLKCESLCRFGAITIIGDEYNISDEKCKRCKMCVTAKYIDGGCLMNKMMFTKNN